MFVDNCIIPREIAIPIHANKSFFAKMFNDFVRENIKIAEKINPLKHHKIKHYKILTKLLLEIKVIFFKITASHPVKTNAKILNNMSLRLKSLKLKPSGVVSKRYLLPNIISINPRNCTIDGVSPKSKNPKISPTRHL